jgi:hypothetical protein
MPLEDEIATMKAKLELLYEQLPGLLRRAIREEREAERASEVIDAADLAQMLGAKPGTTSLAELGRRRARRDPELMKLAIAGGDGRAQYRWHRRSVEGLLAARRHERMKARR